MLSSDFHYKEKDGTTGAEQKQLRVEISKDMLDSTNSDLNLMNIIITFLKWKSDESTKHYLTQMLLAINWRYWQAEKIDECVQRFKVASGKRAALEFTRFSRNKIKSDTFLTEYER